MKDFYCQHKLPHELTAPELHEICVLHQQFFTLPEQLIGELLQERDKIILYRSKATNQIIATVGISYIKTENKVISYLGNTVIDEDYKHRGILAHSQLRNALHLIFKYPLKHKFLCAFASSEKAYHWAQHSPIFWPNERYRTPEHMVQLMKFIARELVGDTHYRVEEDRIIIDKLAKLLKEYQCPFHKDQLSDPCKDSYFYKINKFAAQGEQLLLLGPINVTNFVHGVFYIIRAGLTFWNKS
ncbi:hypothetical protein [Legionella bononiensis]|uniref:N-acetyltransferase domain-containing protein n=1 Tax=Legionella bononiensis TaxID=2793102 RepID=A0ABS1W767_9GAMM|nr:hypothetical protein [Legionella bononiensis]MBL7481302.1 hypothetical protein [Legionella bononiensis]MBL7525206.1 hypothetical protein [Legionella bononiensis]MBL7561389.1 hypothetical protein [Legionella bononiensis]